MASDPLTIARRLTARGLVVIPVHRPGLLSDGKTPAIAWKRFQSQRPTFDDLVHWFAPAPMNLAIITGAISGVVVVDVDGDDGLAWANTQLPETPWRTATAKGVHLWYQHPAIPIPNRVRLPGDRGALPVDVRGDGGFVIGPGSLHASGVWYRARGDWTQPLETLPHFDPAWLPVVVTHGPQPPERVTRDEGRRSRKLPAAGMDSSPQDKTLERARRYLAAIPPPEIGHGSDLQTYIAACHLVRGFALRPTDAVRLLAEWTGAGHRPGWDHEWIAQKVHSASKNGKELMGALL